MGPNTRESAGSRIVAEAAHGHGGVIDRSALLQRYAGNNALNVGELGNTPLLEFVRSYRVYCLRHVEARDSEAASGAMLNVISLGVPRISAAQRKKAATKVRGKKRFFVARRFGRLLFTWPSTASCVLPRRTVASLILK